MTKAQFKSGVLVIAVNGIEFVIERISGGFRAIGSEYVMVFHEDVLLSFVIEKLTEATI